MFEVLMKAKKLLTKGELPDAKKPWVIKKVVSINPVQTFPRSDGSEPISHRKRSFYTHYWDWCREQVFSMGRFVVELLIRSDSRF